MADTIFTQGPSPMLYPSVNNKLRLSTFQEYLKSEERFIQDAEETGPQKVQDRVFEQGLSGEVDFNTLFSEPVISDQNLYTSIKEAKKAEAAGNPSPDQVALLNQARDPNGDIRGGYDYLIPTNPDLDMGIIKTGQFPIDAMTGEVILPKSATGEAGTFVASYEDDLQARAEDAAHLKDWINSRDDAPINPVVRKALLASVEAGLGDAFGERLYSLANATKEGIGFYLPYYAQYGADTLLGRDTSGYTDEARTKELMQFRNDFPMFADRQTVMNDILREQIRLQIGDQEFNRLGLGEKTTVDGVEQYKVNFVSEQFANDMFEELFDMQSFAGKLAMLVGENATAYTAVKAPFTLTGNVTRQVRRGLKGGKDVPFSLMSTDEAAKTVAEAARVRGVQVSVVATEMAKKEASQTWWGRWRANTLARVISSRAGSVQASTAQSSRTAKIEKLEGELARAKRLNSSDVGILGEKLRREIALQNWANVKRVAPYAQEYGIDPVFDTSMAVATIIGRNMADNPQMGELFGALTFLGTAAVAKTFNIKRTPVIGAPAEALSFRAKAATEGLVGSLFSLMGAAKRGYAEGWLVNPNLRDIVNISDDLKNRLTIGELNAFRKFTDGLLKLDPEYQSAVVEDLAKSFEDIDTVVRSLPQEIQQEARDVLQLNLGQAAGLNVFYSVAMSLEGAKAPLKAKDIANVRSNLAEKITNQIDGEKQLAALSFANERMNQIILKLRNSNDPASIEAVNRLEILSSSYKSAYAEGLRLQGILKETDLQMANQILDDLASPSLSMNERDQAVITGQVDQLISLITKSEDKFDRTARDFAGLDVKMGSDLPSAQVSPQGADTLSREVTNLQEKAGAVDAAISKLSTATITAHERIRVANDSATILANASTEMMALTNLARSSSRSVVEAEYNKISTVKNIEFGLVASNFLDLFRVYRIEGESIAKTANPNRADIFGGTTGRRLLNGMNNAAGRGLRQLFNNEQVFSSLKAETGIDFVNADQIIQYFKNDYYGTKNSVLAELGVSSGKDITDLQLALKIAEDADFPISASNLSLVASPLELEDLRQAANVLIKSPDQNKKNIGNALRGNIDNTFNTWGQTLNVEDYNQVARARILARLENQRFDEGTFGYNVERMTAGDIEIIAGGGDMTQLTKGARQVVDILDPLIKNVVNPTEKSTAIVQDQLKRLSITFAPLSPSLADNVLVKGADGKFIDVPTGQQISEGTTPIFELEGFNKLRAIITTRIKNEFLEQRNMKPMFNAARLNRVPSLNPKDMPKPIEVPETFEGNLAAYLESIEESFVFNVMNDRGEVVEMKLFDTDDILMADREITNVVNAVEEYQQTHADLLSVAKTSATNIEQTQLAAHELALSQLAEVNKASASTVGQAFFDNVILSGDANAMTAYLNRANSAIGPDKLQSTMQALFTETLSAAGQQAKGQRTIKMFDGRNVPVDSYQRPDIAFELLDDALTGTSTQGRNLRRLAEAAGIDEDQLKTLHATYRIALRIEAPRLQDMKNAGQLKASTKGFTLDNALSKAFNLARGMVSKEYVAAEVALRYAAMAKDRTLGLIIKDKRASEIVYNVLNDETRVQKEDALYLSQAVMKFIAGDLSRMGVNFDEAVTDKEYIQQYWIDQGVVFDIEPEFFGPTVP